MGKRKVEEQIVSEQGMEDAIQSQLSLNNIPPHWRKAKLSAISNVLYGKARPKSGGQIPVIGSGGIYATTSEPLVTYETLVIGRKGSAGSIYYSPKPCYPSDTTFYLQWTKEVSVPFIYNFLLFQGLAPDKSVIPSLQRGDIESIKIVLPPLSQQKVIANVLRTVQEAILARQDELKLERERKAAMMEYLFTYGARGEQLKQTEIGEIPESWEIGRLRDVIQGIPQNGAFVKQPQLGTGTLYVNVFDIYQSPIINLKTVERMKCEPSFVARYALKEDDILFVRSSLKREGIGQCCLVREMEELAIFDCHLIKVSPDTAAVEPLYLTYFFLSERGRSDLIARSKTTTMTTINQNTLIDSLVPIPSFAEQRDITCVLEACEHKVTALEQEISIHEELFRALLEELMTGRLLTLPLIEESETHE
jgi:type I restriction enzyme S subunit